MKLAILLECDPGTSLGGSCFRDVHNMATHLIERCNYIPKQIHILTTATAPVCIPEVHYHKSSNFLFVIDMLQSDVLLSPNSTVVILVSGHGYSVMDQGGDETDGRDEMINIGTKQMRDDELYQALSLFVGCKLFLLSDTCHSGTLFDLPYIYQPQSRQWVKNSKRNDILKVNATSISACNDIQLSMCDVGETTGFGGSLTTAILEPNILEELINNGEIHKSYESIKTRLNLLGQTAVLSKSSL